MSRYKNTPLIKPLAWGMIAFVMLLISCVFVAWALSNFTSVNAIMHAWMPLLLLCITGAAIILYIGIILERAKKSTLKKFAELDKSEKRNKAIVTALPDMVFIIDRNGHYTDFTISPSQQNIVSPGNFIFKKVADFLPESLSREVMKYIEKVLQTGDSFSHNYQLEVEDDIRSYESRYVPHSKDTIMVLVRDTTEARKQEEDIRESEYKYRTLVEQATDSIFIANFQGNFLVVNPAGCKISQYTEEELLKMRFHDLAVADEIKVMPFKLAEIASGRTSTSERKMRRKDGEIVDVEIAARIIAPNRFLAFVRDITERKKAESDLVRSKEHLRQLTNYIETVHEEQRLNISREIHEELGQQLAVLKMDVSRLGKKITPIEAGLHTGLDRLSNSIDKMIETVRKISTELRPGMLDDIGLMATLDWYCGDFTKRTGIKASFISDITDDKFSLDLRITLFRIFQESLINVVRDSEAKKVDVSIKCQDQQLVLLIADNGKGLDPSADKHKKILGIRVMRERALKLKGTYNVNSLPGKGTTVEVCLPLNELN